MANYFKPNPAGIAETLFGSTGPVYRHIHAFGERVAVRASQRSPVDTGALRRDIRSSLPERGPSSLNLKVGSDVRKPGQEWSYARVVHQGHRALPVQKVGKVMKFRHDPRRGYPAPRNGGKFVYTYKVKAVAGVPYLTRALEDTNSALPPDVQFRLDLVERLVS